MGEGMKRSELPLSGLPFNIKRAELNSAGGTGTIFFDRTKGRITKANLKDELNGILTIEIGGQSTEVIVKQTQTTAMIISDLKP